MPTPFINVHAIRKDHAYALAGAGFFLICKPLKSNQHRKGGTIMHHVGIIDTNKDTVIFLFLTTEGRLLHVEASSYQEALAAARSMALIT